MSKRKSNFVRGGILGFFLALLLACAPPAPPEVVYDVVNTTMANTPTSVANCQAVGGTVLRDPQPPRPASDPGPTIICRTYVPHASR